MPGCSMAWRDRSGSWAIENTKVSGMMPQTLKATQNSVVWVRQISSFSQVADSSPVALRTSSRIEMVPKRR